MAHTLRGRLAKLAGSPAGVLSPMSNKVLSPDAWDLAELCSVDAQGKYTVLTDLLAQCSQCAYDVSDEISATYFTHSRDAKTSLGA